MEERRKRKESAGSVNQVKRHHFDTTISYNLCTKASPPIDFHGVSLDDNALTEILARMPAKSVIRFKLVSKSWLSLISLDYFRRLHTLCRPPPSLILTTLNLGPSSMVKISELSYDSNQGGYIKTSNEKQRMMPFDVWVDNIHFVLRCCNGIMLLMNRRRECYVYNPATNHSEKIFIHGYNLDMRSLYLVFDPSKPPHNYKKVVCISDDNQLPVLAFNSESRSWDVCDEGFTSGKGLMYLIHRDLLYCFNFNVSQCIVCPLPKLADQRFVYHYVLQESSSNGCLYYCAFVGNFTSKPSATLWELQLNGEDDPRRAEWLLKYHHACLPAIRLYMLAFIRETSTLLILDYGKIMAYSFVDTSYKELLHLEPFSTSIDHYIHVNRFGETLP